MIDIALRVCVPRDSSSHSASLVVYLSHCAKSKIFKFNPDKKNATNNDLITFLRVHRSKRSPPLFTNQQQSDLSLFRIFISLCCTTFVSRLERIRSQCCRPRIVATPRQYAATVPARATETRQKTISTKLENNENSPSEPSRPPIVPDINQIIRIQCRPRRHKR